MNANDMAKKAFENAISIVRCNCKQLEKFVGQDLIIETKKDFLEFAERVGDIEIARSYCVIKFGKTIMEKLE